jgi:hypothetical protein
MALAFVLAGVSVIVWLIGRTRKRRGLSDEWWRDQNYDKNG